MPVFRIFISVVAVFLAGLYLHDACFGDGGPFARPVETVVARRWPDADEFRPTTNVVAAAPVDTTPAARVRETFALFTLRDARRCRQLEQPCAS
ncbi:hypothetical protein JQ633_24145 [Bradyrhizobium tropiciagri]|uniref:hypothetical protein n=1 Tax=Bradyrhizobium tropiciagri TaxID=312253 RepID=UPI001BA83585|nr:hypothetical protein [Bradyrhizobium tropiciagri]MBR0873470.1 hypothetical protein [Bradyrhizobium tropiciagri]